MTSVSSCTRTEGKPSGRNVKYETPNKSARQSYQSPIWREAPENTSAQMSRISPMSRRGTTTPEFRWFGMIPSGSDVIPLHFLFLLPRPDPPTTCLVTTAGSGLHHVPRQHAVAVQEVGGGHRLLARELEEQQADGGSSGGDDEAVGVGFDDGAGRALVGALDGSRLVDDQT